MKRVLKITLLLVLLTTLLLATLMAWLVRTEQGSRWLVEQGFALSPVTIEANGISGTLADGLAVETLTIALPLAEVRVVGALLSWRPGSLFAGVVDIRTAHITELSVDIVKAKNSDGSASEASEDQSDEPGDDELFWLDIPIKISIASARLEKLRIDEAQFDRLNLTGSIGHGRLRIKTADAEAYGTRLQLSGKLIGPAPGQMEATGSWQIPAEKLGGSGSFSGDIEKLNFSHVIDLPENEPAAVNFNGTIHDLFKSPRLTGIATWSNVRLPGETVLYSKAGNITVNSDFLSARLEGSNTLLLEDWPAAPMQLQAVADLKGITVDSYAVETLDGQLTGSGRIEYSEGLQGQFKINGSKINTALVNSELPPGQLGFASSLQIESADSLIINVIKADALIADRSFSGQGRARWRDNTLAAVDGNVTAGSNQLTADVKLGKKLAGSIKTNAPDLAKLWPGLQGALNATVILGGSIEQPQVQLTAEAAALSFDTLSLDTFNLNGELQGDNKLSAKLVTTGLVADQQQLGTLEFDLDGNLGNHQSTLNLSGGVVAVALRTSGDWSNGELTQTFEYGRLQPDGFDSWQLQQKPQLRLSATAGKVSAHCWKQDEAGICIADSNWGPNTLQSAVTIDNFALAALQPLLAEGYSIDGTIDADIKLLRDASGQRGELHWRQTRTLLAYADDIDAFSTMLDVVQIDLLSDESETSLTAKLSGEQGLTMTASARVNGPLAEGSPLKATANGRLPSIALLRPLLQRVAQPGELQGELTVDLDVAGTLGDPIFTGGANLNNASLGLLGAGITLSEINIAAHSKGADKLKLSGDLRSGDGRAKISGEVRAAEKTGLHADIRIQGENLASVRTPNLSVDSSPDLTLLISEDVFDISGSITIPQATAVIRKLPKNAVPRSRDAIVHLADRADEPKAETIVTGDVEVILGEQVRFRGFGLDSRLDGKLRLTQSRGGYLRSGGTVRVRDGFLTGYGKELRVDRGELSFTGPLDDPLINIQVSRDIIYEGRQYTVGLRLTGTAQNVKTEPFSRPAMSERDVISFLLLDRPAGNDNDAASAALALGLGQLVPGDGGVFGLDEIGFETNDANEAAMVAGKRINDKLYVRYVFGSLGQPGAFRIRYRLGRGFSLESSTGARQSLDLIFTHER